MTIERLLTPVGRIVWGHPMRAKVQTDPRTKQPKLGKDGQPMQQWSFGIAFTKAEFHQQVLPYLQQEAATLYPHGVPQQFSWKYKDGDTVDRKGQPYSAREGYAGNIVLAVSTTTFAPQVFKFENGAYRQLNENEIKCGDFVRLNLNVKANAPTDPTHTPGLYINPNGVEFVAYGQEIVNSSADPDELFQGAPVTNLPAGASLTPVSSAPVTAPMPGMAPQGYAPQAASQFTPQPQQPVMGQPQQMGGFAQPVHAQQPMQQQLPPPAHDFVNQAGMQQHGFTQPQPQYGAVPAAVQPMQASQPVYGAPMGQPNGAAPAAYPSNGMPGIPQR